MTSDAEVLSVPVGQTWHLVEAFDVHACPSSYSYRQTRFIAFRPKGGEMKSVFLIEKIYVFAPNVSLASGVATEHRGRLRDYIAARVADRLFDGPDQPYRFYMLSRETQMNLPHLPAPARNPQGHCYFTLDSLTSGEKVVPLASASGGRSRRTAGRARTAHPSTPERRA